MSYQGDLNVSLLGAMIRGSHHGIDDELIKSYIIFGSFAEIMIACKKFTDEDDSKMSMHLTRDEKYDKKYIIDKLTPFWVFANDIALKEGVLENLYRPYNMWYDKKETIRKSISVWTIEGNLVPNELYDIMTSFLIEIRCPEGIFNSFLTVDKLNEAKYKCLVISDQHRYGYVACGVCSCEKNNPIFRLNEFDNEWWEKHIETESHKANVEDTL